MSSAGFVKAAGLLLVAFAIGGPAAADAPRSDSAAQGPQTQPAICGSASTQSEMNACFGEAARRSQAVLDALLKELAESLDPDQIEGLRNVQKSWAAYRESQCRWQAAFFEGGSILPTIHATCIDTLTVARISELAINLCEGNGMTGECDASRRYTARVAAQPNSSLRPTGAPPATSSTN